MTPTPRAVRAALAALPLAALAACTATAPRGAATPEARALDTLAPRALAVAAERYRRAALAHDPARGIPRSTNPDGTWRVVGVSDWTSGFFPGTLWQLAEHTGDAALRAQAERWTTPLAAITSGRTDHDLGFQFMSSLGRALRVTGDERWRAPLLGAARTLAARFDPRVGAIRSWDWGTWQYPVIVDNLMNLELLTWAARSGGDPAWAGIARAHADRTLRDHVRPDWSTFHVVEYDSVTGAVRRKQTRQGFADSSTWARGQAWAIHGYTMMARETGDARYADAARSLADRVLPRLPSDHVPCWDYDAPDCPAGAPRDASAAAIMAGALLELGPRVGGDDGARYVAAAERMLASLASPAYLAPAGMASLLAHATGDLPQNGEIDVGIAYADYYFVEALRRWLDLRRSSTVDRRRP